MTPFVAPGARQPFAGQRIAVVGLGRAGLPAARRLRDWGAEVTAWDDRTPTDEFPPPDLARTDALLLSPGIPHRLPAPHPMAAAAIAHGVPILADVEFLFRAVPEARYVGITGTNGKSTTTALLAHILASAGVEHAAGGNLGPAALSLPRLGPGGVYVLEMSSYMLERLATLRFNVAVMLNLSPDHLDRHSDMAGYAAAKAQVFARQGPDEVAIIGQDDAWSRDLHRGVPVSGDTPQPGGFWAAGGLLRDDTGVLADLRDAPALPGPHNAQNAAAATAAALAFGVPRAAIAPALASFAGLPHRQRRIATIDGIDFVDDSKATNADAAARSMATYKRFVWIAGGVAKADGIAPLAPLFPRIARAILIGQAAPDFGRALAAVPHDIAGTLEHAVPAAFAAARATGTSTVLLAPACASFDQFAGFEARGRRFAELVGELRA